MMIKDRRFIPFEKRDPTEDYDGDEDFEFYTDDESYPDWDTKQKKKNSLYIAS